MKTVTNLMLEVVNNLSSEDDFRSVTDKDIVRKFIVDALLPYKKDTSLCGIENNKCCYLTTDGKKCVFGKYLRSEFLPIISNSDAPLFILNKLGYGVLTEEARVMDIADIVWYHMQRYHDSLAKGEESEQINFILGVLQDASGLEFPELIAD